MRGLAVVLLVLGLVACDAPQSESGRTVETLSGPALQRIHDPQKVAAGEQVYRQYCARCHGANAEGHPQWRQRDAEGMYPAPPLNGGGHSWHHSTEWLQEMIRYGSQPGKGRMPAWDKRLSQAEIEAVVEWFQSRWPDRVYAAWYKMQHR